jgi:hypothetical protein
VAKYVSECCEKPVEYVEGEGDETIAICPGCGEWMGVIDLDAEDELNRA